ncbi:MAG: hypothetical protein Q9214_004912 [Letrouitia sp. 1 TL-2023]
MEKEKGWSQPKNMADWSDYLVFDILGDLCYGRSFDTKEPGDNNLKLVPKFIHDYVNTMYPIAQSPFTNPWLWLKPRGLDKLLDWSLPKNVKTYFSFIEDCLKQRISEEKELQTGKVDPKDVRKDMFHYIFQSKDPETGNMGYRHEELFCESDLLIIAGSDTTSTIFAAMFFYLTRTRNADVYAKLTNEIRTTFTHVGEIYAGQRLNSCQYLRAFIDETLRMNPPVSSELSRETLSGGITIDGQHIPKGINVGVSSWSLHHNEDIWPDPFQFIPERWIDGTSSMEIAKSRELDYTFSPFSNGVRGCPGKALAYLEMTITMAKLLLIADIRAVDDLGAGNATAMWGRRNKTQFQTWDAFVATRNGPTVQIKARHT